MKTEVWNLPMPRHPSMLTPEEFAKLKNPKRSIGRKVDTYTGMVGTVVLCKDGAVRVRVRLYCAHANWTCPRFSDAFLSAGGPGLCYVYDTNGKYLADLRNQSYVCDDHSANPNMKEVAK